MANLNKVMLIGNLTRDVELRYTPKGTAVADLGLAINRKTKGPSGNYDQEETTFVDVTLWGRTAEVAQQYTSKGSPLYVEGRLQLDQWDDKNSGQKRSKLKVVGESIQLLGSKGGGGGGPHDQTRRDSPRDHDQRPPANQSQPTPGGGSWDEDDDDIPF